MSRKTENLRQAHWLIIPDSIFESAWCPQKLATQISCLEGQMGLKIYQHFGYLQLIWHFLIQNETILFFPLYLHVMYPGPLRKSYGDKTLFFVIPYYSAFETRKESSKIFFKFSSTINAIKLCQVAIEIFNSGTALWPAPSSERLNLTLKWKLFQILSDVRMILQISMFFLNNCL